MKTKTNQKDVLNILCLEDSPKDVEIMRELLTDTGYVINAEFTDKEKEFVSLLRSKKYNLILSDFKLPGFDGFTALKWSVEICPEVPFICVSGTVGEEIAVELLKNGAVDYVLKDRLEKLPLVIERALNEVKEKKALRDAEETILKERNLLKTIIDNLPVGVFVKDKEYKKIIANPIHLKEVEGHLIHLGKNSKMDILGKTDFDVFPKELAEEFFIDDQEVIQDGSSLMNIEGTGYDEKGKQLSLLLSKIPLRESNGEIIGMIGVATNITERKQAEEAIKATEVRYRRLFESAKDGIIILDAETGMIMDVNPFLVELLGYTTEQFHSKKIWEIGMFCDKLDNEANFLKLRETEYLRYDDLPLRTIDGRKIQVEFISNVYYADKQKVIQCNIRDITDRKKAEAELAKEQNLMDALMTTIPYNIYFKDEASRYIRINKNQSKLFGLNDPMQVVGKTDFDFFTKEHANQAFEDEQEIIRTGQSLIKEEKETWPDHPDTWVLTTKLSLRDKEGNIIGTYGTSMDITVRKETELMVMQKNQEIALQNEEYLALNEELEQTNRKLILAKEKAEESDKLKTSFLQNMSHEIRTPMNGILGFAELLKDPKLPEKKQQEFIKIIEKSGQRMLNIISDIVNISKIETGQIELVIKETNVNSIMKHLHKFFGPEAEKKDLKLELKTGLSDGLCKIETDEAKLTQVISNLLNNALKFTNAGTVTFGYQLKGKVLEFYVKDTGIGIAPENHDIIFERFRQADMSVTRSFEGAGLGLSISKAYVDKLKGKIWVKSELDKGSTFFFNIPYESKVIVDTETPQEVRSEANLSGIHILIAEDDHFCMELLVEILEEEKAVLFLANDGKEALDLVKSAPEIQIVLMDLKMPVMNGFEATKLIKKLKPGLPVIAQSAYAFSNDQDKAKMAGCDDFIGKPLKRELLLSKIHKYISKKEV